MANYDTLGQYLDFSWTHFDIGPYSASSDLQTVKLIVFHLLETFCILRGVSWKFRMCGLCYLLFI